MTRKLFDIKEDSYVPRWTKFGRFVYDLYSLIGLSEMLTRSGDIFGYSFPFHEHGIDKAKTSYVDTTTNLCLNLIHRIHFRMENMKDGYHTGGRNYLDSFGIRKEFEELLSRLKNFLVFDEHNICIIRLKKNVTEDMLRSFVRDLQIMILNTLKNNFVRKRPNKRKHK